MWKSLLLFNYVEVMPNCVQEPNDIIKKISQLWKEVQHRTFGPYARALLKAKASVAHSSQHFSSVRWEDARKNAYIGVANL